MLPLPFPVVVLADHGLLGARLVDVAAEVVAAGLPWVCLRAKQADTPSRTAWARELLGRSPDAFLSVHGDPEACAAVGAKGLHLPSTWPDVAGVRRRLPGVLLGVSCHSRRELEAAARAGADYAFLSPVFPPRSKPLRGEALGPDRFREIVQGLGLPVLALGGVSPERLAEVAAAGAAGAAVLGSLLAGPGIGPRARRYRDAALRVFVNDRR